MKIALLGATGGVGGHFLDKALASGHEVRALARNPDKLAPRPGLSVLRGDATDDSTLTSLLEGAEAVVSCIGNPKGHFIMERSANAILEAAASRPTAPRSVFVTSIGCGGSSWLVRQMLMLIGGRAGFTDYERADARIREETRIPTVLVRPAALTNGSGSGTFRAFSGDGTFARPIPRADVAEFLLAAVSEDTWVGRGGVQLAGRKRA